MKVSHPAILCANLSCDTFQMHLGFIVYIQNEK